MPKEPIQTGVGSDHLDNWMIQTLGMVQPLKYVWDIGAGRGRRGFMIREAYPLARVRGSDINPEFVRQESYYAWAVEDVLDLVKKRQRVSPPYDVVLLCDVIEHFPRGDMLSVLD